MFRSRAPLNFLHRPLTRNPIFHLKNVYLRILKYILYQPLAVAPQFY